MSDLKSWCEVDIKNYYSTIFSPFYYGAKLYLNNEEVSVLTIPDGVTSIKQGVFEGCSSITEVIIPDSVTSIEKFAFFSCKSLANVTLGKNVSSVGERAFDYCSLLTSIYCKPTTPPAIYYSSSTGSFPFNANLKIYVPQDSYSAYRQYSSESSGQTVQRNWYKYKSYIEGYNF